MWSGGREERTVESYTTENPTIACVTAYKMTGEEKKENNRHIQPPVLPCCGTFQRYCLRKAITWLLLSIERHNVSIFKNILNFSSSVQIIHTIIVLSCQIKKIYTVAAGWAFFSSTTEKSTLGPFKENKRTVKNTGFNINTRSAYAK